MKKIMTAIYSFLIGSVSLMASAQEVTEGATPPAATPKTEGAPAVKAVKKKITKAKAAVTETGEEVVATVGANKQEPKPGKYTSEVTLSFGYSSDSGTTKSDASSDSAKTSGSSLELSSSYQHIMGRFAVGPILSYATVTSKSTVGDSSTTTSTNLTGFGLAAEYFFSDVQTEKMVPFVAFSFILTSGSDASKQVINGADGADVKTTNSGNQMSLGGGLKYFLVRHVSLDPALAYTSITSTTKTTDDNTKNTKTKIQLIAGLSTYF